jgi:hypothetical protein
MAELARRSTAGLAVQVQQSRFEDCDPEPASFDLVASFQAWQWIQPGVGSTVAAGALVEGGRLALCWNRPRGFDGPVWDAVHTVYAELAPQLDRRAQLAAQDEREASFDRRALPTLPGTRVPVRAVRHGAARPDGAALLRRGDRAGVHRAVGRRGRAHRRLARPVRLPARPVRAPRRGAAWRSRRSTRPARSGLLVGPRRCRNPVPRHREDALRGAGPAVRRPGPPRAVGARCALRPQRHGWPGGCAAGRGGRWSRGSPLR